MLLGARNEIEPSVVLKVVRVIIANLLADWLLRYLVNVFVIANVDGSVDQEQVYQFTVILLDNLSEESMGICISAFLEQVFSDSVIILRAKLDVPKRILG